MPLRAFVLLPVVAVGLLLACGKPNCGPDNCDGCCVDTHTCAEGSAKNQCGGQGVACQACGADQICFQHHCSGGSDGGTTDGGDDAGTDAGTDAGIVVLPCPAICPGCCTNGLCNSGDQPTSCGSGGGACATCSNAQSCTNLACSSASCTGCVSGNTCHTGQTDVFCGLGGSTCYDCSALGGHCDTASGHCTGGTCVGCLDGLGHCQPGDAKGACGSGGGACATCGTGQACLDAGCQMTTAATFPGDTCAGPDPITFAVGTTTPGTLIGYVNDAQGSCGGTGPDHVYLLTVPAALGMTAIGVTPGQSAFRPVVYLRSACASGELGCALAPGGGTSATLQLQSLAAGTYYLWVDGFSSSSGSYTINFYTQ